ncbi:hypothetical protein K450DRAFT_271275 [Umbelopsis ramanniana AG]|uniref:Uncharacterized protein n=1 Tax=Umbelopsis ramanniana AG TaxID=1314678 RepID=A0AAD5EBX7_UMBRA|nr:uncharacterized protein K450DRAFT_271275 [Umbelopsis ramanniana AG]KAI8580166.1 hypothetical protein K450DRAFT_271275 [Umbelopsis ramanniana AG]
MSHSRISKRAYVVALKRYLAQNHRRYTTIRPPRPRPPSRLLRWRPRSMAVDIPPLDVRMDIDQPHELEAVECPPAPGSTNQPEAMDICPPSPPRRSRWECSPRSLSPSAVARGRLALASPSPPSSPRRSRWECSSPRSPSPSAVARGRLALASPSPPSPPRRSRWECSSPRSLTPSAVVRGRLASPSPSSSPVRLATPSPVRSASPSSFTVASCGVSSPAIYVSCGVSSPAISVSCGVSSPAISVPCGVSSPALSVSCGVSSPAISVPYGVSSPTISVPCGVSSPAISVPCDESFPASSSAPCGVWSSSQATLAAVPLRPSSSPVLSAAALPLASLPASREASPPAAGLSRWKGKAVDRETAPFAALACASSSPGSSLPGTPGSSGKLPERPTLRKIAMPTGRFAFRSREFTFCQASSSTSRFRSPSPAPASRSWCRSRSPSPSARCRRVRRRVAVPTQPAGSELQPATPTIPSSRSSLDPSVLLPLVASKATTTTMTVWQHCGPASSSSRDSTPPMASRDGTISPLELEANLSPVNGPVCVLVDDVEDDVDTLQPLDDFQVLEDASSQPGSPRAEREEQNLRTPFAVLEERAPSDGYSSDDSEVVADFKKRENKKKSSASVLFCVSVLWAFVYAPKNAVLLGPIIVLRDKSSSSALCRLCSWANLARRPHVIGWVGWDMRFPLQQSLEKAGAVGEGTALGCCIPDLNLTEPDCRANYRLALQAHLSSLATSMHIILAVFLHLGKVQEARAKKHQI